MNNEYEVRGDITAIIINSKKHGRHEALISTSKLERAKEFPKTWNVSKSADTKVFYVKGNAIKNNGKYTTVCLHRWITDAPESMVVDHINHNTLDNTDSNLRIVTPCHNQQNRSGAQVNSKSGIRGVSWNTRSKKWRAKIRLNNKHIHIGVFEDIKDAEHAVIEARMKYMPYSQDELI